MGEFTNARRGRILGFACIAIVVLVLATLGLSLGRSPGAVQGSGLAVRLLVMGAETLAILIVGIGLLRFHIAARIAAGLGFVVLAILLGVEVVEYLERLGRLDAWTGDILFALVNSLATTALVLWLAGRALAVVADRPGSMTVATARIVGVVLAIVAAIHLRAAALLGDAAAGPWFSVSVDEHGMRFVGFPGWVAWHVVLLVIAAGLMLGPRTIQVWSARALVASFSTMGLLCVAAAATLPGELNPVLVTAAVLPAGLLAGLAAWLAAELNARPA